MAPTRAEPPPPSTVARVIAQALVEQGVTTVFGVPGNHTVGLVRAFAAAGLEHVGARHEQGAGFMADGYARATGRPGVCLLIDGPGLLNASTALAQAAADSIPMLVITSAPRIADLGMGRGRLHELRDPAAVAAGICRRSMTVLSPANAAELMHRAFVALRCERPGPIHLQVPLDLIDAPAPPLVSRPLPAPPTPSGLDAAAALLTAARDPLLLLGGGAVGAADRLTALAERLDAPVLNTVNGKGLVPADHPLAVGGSPSLPVLARALAESDGLLAIGTELAETDFDLLMTALPAVSSALVRVDIDPMQLTRNATPRVPVLGDARRAVDGLLDRLSPRAPDRGAARASALRGGVRAELHWQPEIAAFFEAIEAAAADAVVVGDSTRPTYYAAWQFERRAPRRYWHSASGFGTLGYALPAAIGARLATGAAVIALIGDGGLQFTTPELSSAAARRIPLPVIVWNNEGYGEIANSLAAAGAPTDAARVPPPDLDLLARAHRCAYRRPRDPATLTAAIRAALGRDRPTVIEAHQSDFAPSGSGAWYGSAGAAG